MKIRYFADTDTLYIEFRAGTIAETQDLDEDTLLDVDAAGNICAMTIEHVTERVAEPSAGYRVYRGNRHPSLKAPSCSAPSLS
jgi:uncharacterized protein YuzE